MDRVNVLDEVFEKIVKNVKIFKNREVLRHDYLPDNLPHREEQIKRV
ncbi:MAG: cell division control protein Cdc6, partial [Candidatus Bathyarchaeia archaeon]